MVDMSFEQPGQKMEMQQAFATIQGIRAEVMAMGGNDTEGGSLDSIISELENHRMTPEAAVQAARAIQNSKQAYH